MGTFPAQVDWFEDPSTGHQWTRDDVRREYLDNVRFWHAPNPVIVEDVEDTSRVGVYWRRIRQFGPSVYAFAMYVDGTWQRYTGA